jgi:hypothetical protein
MAPVHNGNLGGGNPNNLRLNHVDLPHWQLGTKQALQGSDYIKIEPTSKVEPLPTQVDFELPNKKCLLFGQMSKFRIKGGFQVQSAANAAWANVKATEVENVLLAPNWFEMLIKEVAIFHNHYKIASSSETRFIAPFLNAYLYQNMDPVLKKLLCPNASHPANCVPKGLEKWSLSAGGWTEYAPAVFKDGMFSFEYTPLFLFPFFQGSNFITDPDSVPRLLPMPNLGRIQIRFTFFDSQDHIFRNKAGNTSKYQFLFDNFDLVLEEARLAPPFEKQFLSSKKLLPFSGVTRLQLVEPVPNGNSTYRCKFQDILMPEALFVFCLPKTVASGTYKFSGDDSTNIYTAHNIQSLDLSFDGKRFALREPHLGTYKDDEMDTKQLFDHLAIPPFGIRQDANKLTFAHVADGSKNTAFPHVYIPLITGPDRQRIIPALDDGSCIMKKADLEVNFKFTDSNSANNSVYVIYACYTDVATIYDPKNNYFYSPYLKYMN